MGTSQLSAEFGFADGSSRVVSVGPFLPSSQATIGFKNRVKNFNASVTSDFQNTFLSNDGASATNIIAATITTTQKTVLFAKSAEFAYKATHEEGE